MSANRNLPRVDGKPLLRFSLKAAVSVCLACELLKVGYLVEKSLIKLHFSWMSRISAIAAPSSILLRGVCRYLIGTLGTACT